MDAQYFIAIVPPEDLEKEIEEFKNHFHLRYNSKASLRSPAHVTLHMPFRWKISEEKFLHEKLQHFVMNHEKFWLKLNGFDSFTPRVIFINIEENETLTELQKKLLNFCKAELGIFNGNYKKNPFHPHITVAFRDLKKREFFPAFEEFKDKEFKRKFLVDHLTILKHNEKIWQINNNLYF